MKVLVTGGNGFVGSHVVDRLKKENYEVFSPTRSDMNVMHMGDLATYCLDNKIELIVHLAATCGGIGINKDNPGRFLYENIRMGINVLEVARRLNGIKKVVNLGTVCSYPKFAPIPFKEEDLWNGYPEEDQRPIWHCKKKLLWKWALLIIDNTD